MGGNGFISNDLRWILGNKKLGGRQKKPTGRASGTIRFGTRLHGAPQGNSKKRLEPMALISLYQSFGRPNGRRAEALERI